MDAILTRPDELRRLFAGTVEQTFQTEFGITDPFLLDYISDMLHRFVRMETIYKLRNPRGEQIMQVTDMLIEAEQRTGRVQIETHQKIGDFTLFWTGYYPEALLSLKSPDKKDAFIDYRQQGKRSYYIASTYDNQKDAPVWRLLSDEFEICSDGLARVRRAIQRLAKSKMSA